MMYLRKNSGSSMRSMPSGCLEVKQTRKTISVRDSQGLGGWNPGLGKGATAFQCHLCRTSAFLAACVSKLTVCVEAGSWGFVGGSRGWTDVPLTLPLPPDSRYILLPVVLHHLHMHLQEQKDLVMCARILSNVFCLIKKNSSVSLCRSLCGAPIKWLPEAKV